MGEDAREREDTDHGCSDRHRVHFGLFAGHLLELSGNQPGEAQETFRGGLPCLGIRAREFTPEWGKDTTGRRLVPVAAGYVFADEQGQRLIGRLPLDLGFEAGGERLTCLTAGFGNELVLGGEMAVETAVGEPGSPHQPGETSLRDSVAQELGARRLEYALACFGGFLFLLSPGSILRPPKLLGFKLGTLSWAPASL